MNLPHRLDRAITIDAPRDLVFRFFTDSASWASWWGEGSTIDPRVGGRVYIRHPGNVEVVGEILTIRRPDAIAFTYGFASGQPFPAGGSLVTIALETAGAGTRLTLSHEFPDAASRDGFIQGWRYQLALFSNAVLNQLHANAAAKVDAWFRLWTETDAVRRAAAISAVAADTVTFRDRYSLTDTAEDLSAHIAAAQRFMPGIRLERRGNIRHCQGTVIADWNAVGADGSPRGTGANVFAFGGDGRIQSATGFWG